MADLFCVMAIFHNEFSNLIFLFSLEISPLDFREHPYYVNERLFHIFLHILNKDTY